MSSYFKILFFWLLPLLLFFNLVSVDYQSNNKKVHHSIVLNHPGEKDEMNVTLTEVKNKEGLAMQYYMDVESVICLEEVCKVIPVMIFWNNIGQFQKYQLQKGATLEKYEADLFEPDDYKKLDSILNDQNSPFKEVFMDEILTVPDSFNAEVDALSGETILELEDSETVHGAALTCYTLWHWANGEIVSIIKNKTGESASQQQLDNFILNENNTYFYIAIQELHKRKLYTKPFIDSVVEKVLNNHFLLKTAILYLKNAPLPLYLRASKRLFFDGKKEQKLAVIRSLKNTDMKVPSSYLDELGAELNNLNSYQEVSLLLELMQYKNPNSKMVIDTAFPMLKGNFLIARRVYWFLKSQKLNETDSIELDKFHKKNKGKL